MKTLIVLLFALSMVATSQTFDPLEKDITTAMVAHPERWTVTPVSEFVFYSKYIECKGMRLTPRYNASGEFVSCEIRLYDAGGKKSEVYRTIQVGPEFVKAYHALVEKRCGVERKKADEKNDALKHRVEKIVGEIKK